MQRVYLDHNATTPVHPAVVEAMTKALREDFGNPSSVHHFGQRAKAAIDQARSAVAALIGAEPSEVVFTSGGTESDNFAIRGVAEGCGPNAKVRDGMSQEVKYCFDDEDTDHVARNMADQQVRRLPVVNRDKRLVGILSLGDLAVSEAPRPAGEALSGISRPGGQRSQTGRSRTWINRRIRTLYCKLHEIGHCHSVEAWRDGTLVGGLYGVRLGRAFFGESMFHRERDASKVALKRLCDELLARGLRMIDCQMATPHLLSLGAQLIPRPAFIELLGTFVDNGSLPDRWADATPASADSNSVT